ncbi:MAG: hypothetical protein H6977_14810 [Gammaproteobacteria bacterium]|nr:hypothetical protein [Gammaproteobacteria bacterium]MCP5201280.1 hypothetical protein [Gammaproteobacteria bacterium]
MLTSPTNALPGPTRDALMLQAATDSPLWLVGIDDTDNLETRGTGHGARSLIAAIEQAGLARGVGVTRHQLLVDDRIPYTSHNSSACLQLSDVADTATLFEFCRRFMLDLAARGADVGLCLASLAQAAGVIAFGRAAKTEVLDQGRARRAAGEAGIRLEGLTGTRDGIIGSLAGVGLFADGNDGRYLWQRRLRELTDGVASVAEIIAATGVDDIRVIDGDSLRDQPDTRIALGPWPRPVRIDGSSVLLVSQGSPHEHADYACIDKQRLKAFRP